MCSLSVFEKAKAIKENGFPSRLFKYRCFDEKNHWIDWVKGEIYLSSASSFNDPFDCSYTTDIQIYRDHFIRIPVLDFLRTHLKLNKADIIRIEVADDPLVAARTVLSHHCYQLDNEIDQLVSLDKFERLLQGIFLVSCFSEVNDSILMWSHYSDKHQGFCIEYDFRNNEQIHEMTFPVIYSDERVNLQIEPDTVEKSWIISSVLSKSGCWSYEHEWRFISVDPDKESKQTNFHVDARSCVRAIYVGARVTDDNMKKISYVASILSLPVYRMTMDNASFRLYPIKV